MALYSDLGARCSFTECKQHDFLPFKCECCSGTFCLDHRTSESHNCAIKPAGVSIVICPVCSKTIRINPGDERSVIYARHTQSECRQSNPIPTCPVSV